MGTESHEHLINDTNTLYTKLMLDSGVNQMVFDFFVPTAEERERSKAWENLGRMWFSFIESRGRPSRRSFITSITGPCS